MTKEQPPKIAGIVVIAPEMKKTLLKIRVQCFTMGLTGSTPRFTVCMEWWHKIVMENVAPLPLSVSIPKGQQMFVSSSMLSRTRTKPVNTSTFSLWTKTTTRSEQLNECFPAPVFYIVFGTSLPMWRNNIRRFWETERQSLSLVLQSVICPYGTWVQNKLAFPTGE